jgi:hypothetical protein
MGVFLASVGKCRTAKVNNVLTSSFLLNWRNPQRKFFNYETWVFTYDSETKPQSMQWKSTSSPRPKKARMSLSKFMGMLIVFFDIQGIVTAEWVPSGIVIAEWVPSGTVTAEWVPSGIVTAEWVPSDQTVN